MKKKYSVFISILLCIFMIFPVSPAVYAEETGTEHVQTEEERAESLRAQARGFNRIANFVVNNIFGEMLKLMFRDCSEVVKYKDFNMDKYAGFYPGMKKFIDSPAENSRWSLGFGSSSVVPADLSQKKYYKGAYLPDIYGDSMYKDDDGNPEDLKARAVIMNDGSGRGSVIFIVLDCIGISNADVRLIREALKDFAARNNIVSINVSATHIHTGIDSQGIWGDPVTLAFRNSLHPDTKHGVDRDFLNCLINGSVSAVKKAFADMKTGELYYTSFNAGRYFTDRKEPRCYDPNIYKLEFAPDDKQAAPTIIASFGCHPESASYDWMKTDKYGRISYDRQFSADFIYYMEKLMNLEGYNFMYIQGNVSVVTSVRGYSNDELPHTAHDSAMRLGYELGYVVLSTGMNRSGRMELNKRTGDRLGVEKYGSTPGYSPWYNGLYTKSAVKVSPYLNIAHETFLMPVENNIMAAVAKTGIADNKVIKKGPGQYFTVTEVGYLQVGDAFRAMLSPGETYSELRLGGELLKNCPVKSISETVGPDVILMDLMNDAVGYLANEGNYVIAGVEYDEYKKEIDDNTWCIFSFGKSAGTVALKNFYALCEKVK